VYAVESIIGRLTGTVLLTLHTAFLDVKKAFDSVSHSKLLRVLSQQGVPHAWVGLTHHLLSDRCTLLGDTAVPTERGTPQGSPPSPLLFTLFTEPLTEQLSFFVTDSPSSYGQGLKEWNCVLTRNPVLATRGRSGRYEKRYTGPGTKLGTPPTSGER
jgi:hypothetical protein